MLHITTLTLLLLLLLRNPAPPTPVRPGRLSMTGPPLGTWAPGPSWLHHDHPARQGSPSWAPARTPLTELR